MTGRDVLEAALRYASCGWPVLPCRPDGTPEPDHKAPLTAHGFKDATTDRALIRAWWRRWPTANVAIRTGQPGPDVLDVDQHGEAGNGFAAYRQLKQAGLLSGASAIVITGSRGLHLYFDGSRQRNGKLARLHLDFRSSGGYVIAPPSVVLGRPYELHERRTASGPLDWQAVRELLGPQPDRRPRPGGQRYGIDGLVRLVASQREGNRNDALFWAACRAAEEGVDAAAELAGAAISAGLTETEARRTIYSAYRKASA